MNISVLHSKKIISLVSGAAIFALAFYVPLNALANFSVSTGNTNSGGANSSTANTGNTSQVQSQATTLTQQGNTAQNPQGSGQSATSQTITAGATALGECSVGNMASQMIVSTVAKLFGVAQNKATTAATQQASTQTAQAVPILAVGDTQSYFKAISTNIANQTRATYSSSADQGGTFDGITSIGTDAFHFPGLNAIGFCIVNEIIHYIAQSTIVWIQNGFQGSPVYISNTGQFFQGVADQEAGNFVNGLAKGTLGINLCQPFKVEVLSSVLGGAGSGGGNPLNCSLSAINSNFQSFTNGNWNSGGLPGWFELIQTPNNPYGATILAQKQLATGIYTQQNNLLINLNWAQGYRDFKVCPDGSKLGTDGTCPNNLPPKTTTLGGYIQSQVNARGAAPLERLNIATDFDQVVSALVNELIKIAVNESFNGNSGTGQQQ